MQYTTQMITGKNFTITVHKPILSDSERKKRERDVVQALEQFGKEMEKRK